MAEPPESDIPNLDSLCVTAAVKGFKKNFYSNSEVSLQPQCSQMIFNKIHTPHLHTAPEIVSQIKKKLTNVKSVVLGRNNFNESHRQMVYSQDALVKLTLLDFRPEEKFWLERPGVVDQKKGRKLIDIISFLKECICPNSRQTLKELRIQGYVDFPEGWITELHQSFPAIKVLETTNCGFTNGDFVDVCELYPALIELYISGTSVNNINGIEKLTQLRTLAVGNLEIEHGVFFFPLTAHPSLEFLDVSCFRSKKKFRMLYGWFRPPINLKILDVSGNHLKGLYGMDFMASCHDLCPQLEIIAIDTVFFKPVDDQFADVPCFYFESDNFYELVHFEKCISLLELFKKNGKRCYWVLLHLLHNIETEVRRPGNIRTFVKCLIDLLKNPWQNFQSQFMAIECLWSFSSEDWQLFSRVEKVDILKTLCVAAKKAEWKQKTDFGYKVFHSAFYFLDQRGWEWGLDKAEVLWDLLLHALPDDFFSFEVRKFCYFLNSYKKPIDLKNHLKSSEIIKYKQNIMEILRSVNRDMHWKNFNAMINFFSMLLKSSDLESENAAQNLKFAENLFLHMHHRRFDEVIVENLFECLVILYPRIPDYWSRRELIKTNLDIFEYIFLHEERRLKVAAATFCMQGFKLEMNLLYYSQEPFVPYTEEQLAEMHDDFLRLICRHREYNVATMLGKLMNAWFDWIGSEEYDWIHEQIYREF
ncbi:unnamed protein product [Caenorhabditis brenneri]